MSWSKEITEWQVETFGEVSPEIALERAAEEWAELFPEHLVSAKEAIKYGTPIENAEEAADVVITLAAFVRKLGFDLAEMVEKKMTKNRARRWRVDASGKGYHIKDGE